MKLKGIDVSSHQGKIDWDSVKNSGIDFAILRLGFGSDIESQDDETFERNVKECDRVGIPWGAYLYSYALTVEDAKSEANHALRLLKGKNPKYPIVFDMEDADCYKNDHGMPSHQTLVNICKAFLSTVEDAGYYVSLYASLSWLNNQLNTTELDRYDKWVAQWNSTCNYKKPYGIWQYSDSGSVDGINGRVDMNYSYKDYPAIISGNNSEPAKTEEKQENNAEYYIDYTIKKGDTLSGIAAQYGQFWTRIAEINNIKDPNLIYPGQKIKIPQSGSNNETYYTVKSGDTLWGIAEKYLGSGNKYTEIKIKNGLTSDTIYPGQKLKI
jgi:GH25 family lysozyme M1 (1,4-beta-N-acetylmuramidase)